MFLKGLDRDASIQGAKSPGHTPERSVTLSVVRIVCNPFRGDLALLIINTAK